MYTIGYSATQGYTNYKRCTVFGEKSNIIGSNDKEIKCCILVGDNITCIGEDYKIIYEPFTIPKYFNSEIALSSINGLLEQIEYYSNDHLAPIEFKENAKKVLMTVIEKLKLTFNLKVNKN